MLPCVLRMPEHTAPRQDVDRGKAQVVSPPTGTVTFLFTDIEGSKRLWENNPPEVVRAALTRHNEIMRGAIEAHEGYVFKTMGDSFCAAFASVTEAVLAALEAQRALFAEKWNEDCKVRVRMGLHTGIAIETGDDYLGQEVNRVH